MTARKKFIVVVLFAATLDWGLWLGGQFFNALMIIPGWSYDPPASIRLYQEHFLAHMHAYFFMVANPVFLLPLLIICWLLCRKRYPAVARSLALATGFDLFITLVVGLVMAPFARGLFSAAAGTFSPAALSGLHVWRIANACRVVLGMVTMLLFLAAVSRLHLLRGQKLAGPAAATLRTSEP
jgi:hypothetical protein